MYRWKCANSNTLAVFAVIAVLVTLTITALVVGALPDPDEMDMAVRYAPPTFAHPLGTDQYGRDVFSRVVHGLATTVKIGFIATSMSLVAGSLLGGLAGYAGRFADGLVMRFMDGLMAFPGILLALALVAVLGSATTNIVIALGIMGVPSFARVARAGVLKHKNETFVEAARAQGASHVRILLVHIAPGVSRQVFTQAGFAFAAVVLSEAALSYLGLGVPPPEASLGRMLKEAQTAMGIAWWIAVGPGVSLALLIFSANALAQVLSDSTDKRSQTSEVLR